MYLMLLRQVGDVDPGEAWEPNKGADRLVHPADVVLSLALYLSRVGPAALEGSAWDHTGQVVSPSIDDVVAEVERRGSDAEDTEAKFSFKGSAGRLTLRNAQEAMAVP